MAATGWVIAALVPVALLTMSWSPWSSGFPLTYVGVALLLRLVVRFERPGLERFVHIFVLAGAAPTLVDVFFGNDLPLLGAVHAAVLSAISIGLGYLGADLIRAYARVQRAA
jgi:hypothetical protein